jgi:hypothetical protein
MARPTIHQSRTSVARECACGTRIPDEGIVFGILHIRGSVRGLVRGQAFCSPKCIRRFLFEAIEMVETLATPRSASVVSDLQDLHRGLAEALAWILDDPEPAIFNWQA